MSLSDDFAVLSKKEITLREGIDMLDGIRADLMLASDRAEVWGQVNVMANVVLVPLNCIVNAFELKGAGTLYQVLVKALYDRYAKSGTRNGDSKVAGLIGDLRRMVVEDLLRRALTEYVPGVNIIFGLAQDSLAAYRSMQLLQDARIEQRALVLRLDTQLAGLSSELRGIGIRKAQLFDRAQKLLRTA